MSADYQLSDNTCASANVQERKCYFSPYFSKTPTYVELARRTRYYRSQSWTSSISGIGNEIGWTRTKVRTVHLCKTGAEGLQFTSHSRPFPILEEGHVRGFFGVCSNDRGAALDDNIHGKRWRDRQGVFGNHRCTRVA